jgi:hypothetical protein
MKLFVMNMIWNAINWLTKHKIGSLDAYYTQVNWYQESEYMQQPFWSGTIQLFSYWSPVGVYPVWRWHIKMPMALADILNLRFLAKHPDDVPFFGVKPVLLVKVIVGLFIRLWNKGIGLNRPSFDIEYHNYRRFGVRGWFKTFFTRHPLSYIVSDAKSMLQAYFAGSYDAWWKSVQAHRTAYHEASSNDFMWGGDDRTKVRVKAMFAEEELINSMQIVHLCKYNRCLGAKCVNDECECECHHEDGDYYAEWNANFSKDVGLR